MKDWKVELNHLINEKKYILIEDVYKDMEKFVIEQRRDLIIDIIKELDKERVAILKSNIKVKTGRVLSIRGCKNRVRQYLKNN